MSTEKANITPNTTPSDLALHRLDPRMQRFVNLYMTGNHTIVKLAQLLDVHPATVQKWLKREDVKSAIVEAQGAIHEQVSAQIKSLTLKAANRLNDLMDSPIDGVALQAVNTVLDRGGHKQKQEIKVDKTVVTMEEKLKSLIDTTIIEVEGEIVDEE